MDIKKYFFAAGRDNRMEYLVVTIVQIVCYSLLALAQDVFVFIPLFPLALFALAIVLFYWTVVTVIRRFHDLGKSGWNYLWFFVPIVNFIVVLILFFKSGTDGHNQYNVG